MQSSGDMAGIVRTISNGVHSSQLKGSYPRAMGAFGNRLSRDEVQSLAQFVLSLSNE